MSDFFQSSVTQVLVPDKVFSVLLQLHIFYRTVRFSFSTLNFDH